MSYAIKDGDKFYWMNPPDVKKGDEHLEDGKWVNCGWHPDNCRYPRRRPLDAEGYRIVGLEDQMPLEYEVLSEFDQCWTSYYWPPPGLCTVKEWLADAERILAIRVKVEKDFPKFWGTGNKNIPLCRADNKWEAGWWWNNLKRSWEIDSSDSSMFDCASHSPTLKSISESEATRIIQRDSGASAKSEAGVPVASQLISEGVRVPQPEPIKPEPQANGPSSPTSVKERLPEPSDKWLRETTIRTLFITNNLYPCCDICSLRHSQSISCQDALCIRMLHDELTLRPPAPPKSDDGFEEWKKVWNQEHWNKLRADEKSAVLNYIQFIAAKEDK